MWYMIWCCSYSCEWSYGKDYLNYNNTMDIDKPIGVQPLVIKSPLRKLFWPLLWRLVHSVANIAQQVTIKRSAYKHGTHLSCKTWHTLQRSGLVFIHESGAMTQVSLISVFIPLLPTVIRSRSCFPPPLFLFLINFSLSTLPPSTPLPIIFLIQLRSWIISPSLFFLPLLLKTCAAVPWLDCTIHLSRVTQTSRDYRSFFFLPVCVCVSVCLSTVCVEKLPWMSEPVPLTPPLVQGGKYCKIYIYIHVHTTHS